MHQSLLFVSAPEQREFWNTVAGAEFEAGSANRSAAFSCTTVVKSVKVLAVQSQQLPRMKKTERFLFSDKK